MIRSHGELIRIKSYFERFEYLKLSGIVGESTFGYDRYINQMLYTSGRWRRTRKDIIIRDDGCDLSHVEYEIHDVIIIHHINPITLEDIEEDRDIVYDPENLVCTSTVSHNAIHYGDISSLPKPPIVRSRNDTCPWKQ